MKMNNKIILLFFFVIGLALQGYAADNVKVGNLTYYISSYTNEASVCSPGEGEYSGDIVIPSSITYGGKEYPVTGIFSYAFCYEDLVTSVSIPNSIKKIGTNAFLGCRSLKTLTIPESVNEIGVDPFGGCTLNPLIILTKNVNDYSKVFSRLKAGSVVLTYESEISKMKSYYYNVQDLEAPYMIDIIDTYIKGVKLRLVPNEYQTGSYKLSGVNVNGVTTEPDENDVYFFKGLDANNNETWATVNLLCKNDEGATKSIQTHAKLKSAGVKLMPGSPTHTTMTYYVSANVDETAIPINANVRIYAPSKAELESSSEMVDGKATIVFTGLYPNSNYSVLSWQYPQAVVTYEDRKTCKTTLDKGFATKTIAVNFTDEEITPTTYKGHYTLQKGDYTMSQINLCVDQNGTMETIELSDNNIYLRGLNPNTYISLSIVGTGTTKSFKTLPLELTTLQPKCVSPTCAIVAATTNISEEETNVGFQWKKYDAPSSLAPKDGYAAIYNGQLEGYIKNLQSTSYYNVRAFYKSDAGKYFYSDWVTFDPSDYSYFEPTVHTFEAFDVGHNSAKVKAYVMAGTDEVIEQGFEYWPSATPESKTISAKAAPQDESSISTVLGTGQVMIVTLTDLQPNCAYTFRSFVKTASGTTYGEEQMLFTESDPTGIDNVVYGIPASAITGYYDLEGRKHNALQKGLNIVRYSDGSVRKVMAK